MLVCVVDVVGLFVLFYSVAISISISVTKRDLSFIYEIVFDYVY